MLPCMAPSSPLPWRTFHLPFNPDISCANDSFHVCGCGKSGFHVNRSMFVTLTQVETMRPEILVLSVCSLLAVPPHALAGNGQVHPAQRKTSKKIPAAKPFHIY